MERNFPQNVSLAAPSTLQGNMTTMAILVEAMGRINFGCVW